MLGGLGRNVADVALLTDVLAEVPFERPLADAARTDPRPLRIAISLKPSLPTRPQAAAGGGRAHGGAAALAGARRGRARPSLPADAGPDHAALPRRRGARSRPPGRRRAGRAPHAPDGAVGRRLSGGRLRRALEREPAVAARLQEPFADHDVLLTPAMAHQPGVADASRGKGAFATFDAGRPYVCYTAQWNYTGQPAASVPAGLDEDGMPVGSSSWAGRAMRRRSWRWRRSSSARGRGRTGGRRSPADELFPHSAGTPRRPSDSLRARLHNGPPNALRPGCTPARPLRVLAARRRRARSTRCGARGGVRPARPRADRPRRDERRRRALQGLPKARHQADPRARGLPRRRPRGRAAATSATTSRCSRERRGLPQPRQALGAGFLEGCTAASRRRPRAARRHAEGVIALTGA